MVVQVLIFRNHSPIPWADLPEADNIEVWWIGGAIILVAKTNSSALTASTSIDAWEPASVPGFSVSQGLEGWAIGCVFTGWSELPLSLPCSGPHPGPHLQVHHPS